MRRSWIVTILALGLAPGLALGLVATAGIAFAASDTPRGEFGLGVIVGEPTGVSLKFGTGQRNAFDMAVAWSLDDDTELHIHGDYLRHTNSAIDVDGDVIPAYYGIGVRVRMNEGRRDDDIGIRFPLGLAWVFADGGLETFLELAPILDLAPDTDLDVNAAIGLRYIFGGKRNE